MRHLSAIVRRSCIGFVLCANIATTALAQPVADDDAQCRVPSGTEPFQFAVNDVQIRGYIDRPDSTDPVPAVLMVNGSLPTNVMSGTTIGGLRQVFRNQGIAFVTWDTPGSGCSDGDIDVIPDLYQRAEELDVAIARIRNRNDIDITRIGVLALSQGSWVASIAAARSEQLAFIVLLSAPGTDMTDQAVYLVRTNLLLEGYPDEEVVHLTYQYRRAQTMAIAGANYDHYTRVIESLIDHPFFRQLESLGGNLRLTPDGYRRVQTSRSYLVSNRLFLSSVTIPVLAIYGARDSLVDWEASIEVLGEAVGRNIGASFSPNVLEDTDHNMCLAETGSVTEMMEMIMLGTCDVPEQLAQTVVSWLNEHGFSKATQD